METKTARSMNIFYEQFRKQMSSNVPLDLEDPLNEIRTEYKTCRECSLCTNREASQQVVFGSGPIKPKILVVGPSPSRYDADVGVPFSDKLGDKLRGMVSYLGRHIELENNVYYTNLVLCPGDLNEEAIVACWERFQREIELVNPKVLLFLGDEVAKAFVPIPKHGKALVFNMGDRYYTAVMTHTLKDLVFRNAEVVDEVKADLDLLVRTFRDVESLTH